MKVLLVYHELGFRGGERLFSTLAKGLILKGNKVVLLVGRFNKESIPFPKEVKIVKPPNVINTILQNNWLFALFSMPYTFLNIMRTVPSVDVIYCGESFTGLWPTYFASVISKKKLVVSVFELGKRVSPPSGWQGILHTIWEYTNNFIVKKVKFATTINSSLVTPLNKNFGIPNVFSIPAGIDFNIFNNPKPEKVIKKYKLKGNKIILMQGLLHPQKKQDLSIKAFSLVKGKVPNNTLIIAGGGNQNYLKKLKKLTLRLKVEKDTIFAGYVPNDELKNYYAASDVVLMCGPIAGLTVIEALYFDKLTIYPTSGKPPFGPVEEYGLGIITKTKSAQEFSKYIVDVLTNPEKYKGKIEKDKKLALNKFSMKSFTKATLEVFKYTNH